MRNRENIIKLIALIALVIIIAVIAWEWLYNEVANHGLLLSAGIAYFSVFIALFAYFWKQRIGRFQFGNEKRHQFITDERFMKIRSKIERNDIELQAIVATVNSDPYHPDVFLDDNDKKWCHECFDDYLNWIEGFAILWGSGMIENEEIRGLWSYYAERLEKATMEEERFRKHLSQNWNYSDTKINSLIAKARKRKKEREEKKGWEGEPDPIIQPIWFYVTEPEYQFDALIKLVDHVSKS